VVEALRRAGVTVVAKDSILQPFFSPTGRIFAVNGQDVQLFVYPDAGAAAAEASRFTPDGSSPGMAVITWVDDPHFFRTGNVIALYVGKDEAVLRALRAVFGQQFAGR
jgi:hypothetical protein